MYYAKLNGTTTALRKNPLTKIRRIAYLLHYCITCIVCTEFFYLHKPRSKRKSLDFVYFFSLFPPFLPLLLPVLGLLSHFSPSLLTFLVKHYLLV